jgi:hypothetical protein
VFCLQGCVNLVYLCGKNKKQHVAGLTFFHMLLVVWCFGVGCLHLQIVCDGFSAEVRG